MLNPLLVFVLLCLSCPTIIGQPHTWNEVREFLGISMYPNGSMLNRTIRIPMVPPTPSADVKPPPPALSQDVYLTWESQAYIRLYIPPNPPKNKKLPLIVYFHGGDFVLYSASTVIFHNFCNDITSQLPAVVASVEYRLAPENRLPAAYEDAINALIWAKNQSLEIGGRDPWMEYADFSRIFLLGSSAGANIAYNVAIRAMDLDLRPLRINGLILNQGFFGGAKLTESELRLKEDRFVPLIVARILWKFALPKDMTLDHEFCNPISGGNYSGRVYHLLKVYVKGDYGDPLVDRSVQLVQLLASCNVSVFSRFNAGGHHGIELVDKTAAEVLYNDIKWFVYSDDNNAKIEMPQGIVASSSMASE